MNRFKAADWLKLAHALDVLGRPNSAISFSAAQRTQFADILAQYQQQAEVMGLNASATSTRRLREKVSAGSPPPDLKLAAAELQGRIDDEMEAALCLSLSPREKDLYGHAAPFGNEVADAFPSAAYDIEEAAKCLALERATACVFHLVRVLEVGLHELGAALGVPDLEMQANPTWEAVLAKCDKELAKPAKSRDPKWESQAEFFAEAVAQLRAVKVAWRNPTMHVDRVYDPSRAEDIWGSVRAYMRHLATKLHEEPQSS
ncbi:MAG TPA: hypothetical protein VNF24_04735 [Candidatus Acidoferrales bacterium]|nr:hypothetical protein [Candidatus Acidoferrales bacterium]